MHVCEAQQFVGKVCCVHWQDRTGREFSTVSRVHEVVLMGIYGTFLVTDTEDVALEKITSIEFHAQESVSIAAGPAQSWELVPAA